MQHGEKKRLQVAISTDALSRLKSIAVAEKRSLSATVEVLILAYTVEITSSFSAAVTRQPK